jgi:hypothetical protein
MATLTRAFIGSTAEMHDFGPLLRFLLLNILIAFGLVVLWYFGLLQLVLSTDHTHIAVLIFAIFCLTGLHCLYQTVVISRELVRARKVRAVVVAESGTGLRVDDGQVSTGNGTVLEPGIFTNHIINIIHKRRLQAERHVDQTLLLRSLADKLRSREKLGLFVSEALLRLALLGTAIGFILMLIPIAALTSFESDTLRGALGGMTGGMAVALNVTVAGIASALLLKLEYYLLDNSIGELFEMITETTEIHVVSALEQAPHARN